MAAPLRLARLLRPLCLAVPIVCSGGPALAGAVSPYAPPQGDRPAAAAVTEIPLPPVPGGPTAEERAALPKGLIGITHGWMGDNTTWVKDLGTHIRDAIPTGDGIDWVVVTFNWADAADTWTPAEAMANGQSAGRRTAKAYETGWTYQHMYGHSAGSHFIDFFNKATTATTSQLTFMDAYEPRKRGDQTLGAQATFAEQYADNRELHLPRRGYTNTATQFPFAFHIDVTDLDTRTITGAPLARFTRWHAFPYLFIDNTVTDPTGTWASKAIHNGKMLAWNGAMEKNAGAVPSYDDHPEGGALTITRSLVTDPIVPEYGPEALFSLEPGFHHNAALADSTSVVLTADAAADTVSWYSQIVELDARTNYMRFDYEWLSQSLQGAPGEAWLGVYVDRDRDGALTDFDLVFAIDELVSYSDQQTLETFDAALFADLAAGPLLIGFRIDALDPYETFTGSMSSVAISNVAFGFIPAPGAGTLLLTSAAPLGLRRRR